MKNYPLLSIVFLLLFSVSVLTLFSYTDDNISLLGIDIKKSRFKELFTPNNSSFVSDSVNNSLSASGFPESGELNALAPDSIIARQIDTNSQRILLAGDSMVEGLMYLLSDYCVENGHELFPVIWYSSSSKAYAQKNKLKELINKYNATYVILVLGANELFVRDLDNRDEYIKEILNQSDGVKFVWIGPPNWKEDTGINDLILKNMGKDRYYPSKNLKYDRISDGAHPTRKSSNMWAEKIAEWIVNESKYPILFNQPEKEYRKKLSPMMMNYAK
ncbi:MAG: SGNH/GDSL hydrolase family protein [Ignavibacteriae bacterium]|nr:SGNH/GDSL hydrolase family protein [Ignavibacteriota bacterium]